MAFSPETYALCQKNTSEQIGEALTSVYSYKGAVDTLDDLPLYGNKVGDVYDVRSEGGQNYGWDGEKWDSLGLNREATETDLGLIRTKNNTFNNTTFVGDLTAINSTQTSITGNGITSINGLGNFEVSKPLTVIASATTNIGGETTNISPSSKINLTSNGINLTANNSNSEGITLTTGNNPLTLTGKITINGEGATYINTPVIGNSSITSLNLIATNSITTENLVAKTSINSLGNIYGKNYGGSEASTLITTDGAKNNIVLGSGNSYSTTSTSVVQNIENIVIGSNNKIANTAADNFIIGQRNVVNSNYSTVLGLDNNSVYNYNFIKGLNNTGYALGLTVFGSKNNSSSAAEFGFISGVNNTVNGKTAAVLGNNLSGSTVAGSMTIGSFNANDDGKYLLAIGNGYEDESGTAIRQNALSVDEDGIIETPFYSLKNNSLIIKNSSSSYATAIYMPLSNQSNLDTPWTAMISRGSPGNPSITSGILKVGSSGLISYGLWLTTTDLNKPTAPGEIMLDSNSSIYAKASTSVTIDSGTDTTLNCRSVAIKASSSGAVSISGKNTSITSNTISLDDGNNNGITLYGQQTYCPCYLNTKYNGIYVGTQSSNKAVSSRGTISCLGDNLEYVNGSDNDSNYNSNGILIIGNYNNKSTPTKDNLFIVGNGYQAGDIENGSNALRLTSDGMLYYKTGMGEGADYAEFFEWSDGNPDGEDRCGVFVTFDFDKEYDYSSSQELPHIKPANDGDYILGVISGNPSFVGNSDEEWKKRWLYDEFDRPIMEAIQVPITELQEVETGEFRTEIEYDEDDNEIEVQIPIVETQEVETGEYKTKLVQVPNPNYNPSETYISRSNRKEWETTGLLGVLSVKDDGTCQVGKFCKCGQNGIATLAEERGIDTFLVLKRVNDNIIKIIFK